MLGLRQAFRLSLRLSDGLCLNALSSYQHQCHQRLYKFPAYKNILRQFSIETNTAALESNSDDNKASEEVTRKPVGKLEGRLNIQFTCKKCNTRNSKTMTKLAYTKGVVIIRCDGCKNNHLIADNLGWFGIDPNKRNIEKLMKLNGESVKRISDYDNVLFEVVSKDEETDVNKKDQN